MTLNFGPILPKNELQMGKFEAQINSHTFVSRQNPRVFYIKIKYSNMTGLENDPKPTFSDPKGPILMTLNLGPI